MVIKLFLSFASGLLTIFSPCVLPMLPILLGVSFSGANKTRSMFIIAGFVISFACIALIFTIFTTILGLDKDLLRKAGIILLAFFGLLMIWPGFFEKLSRIFNKPVNEASAWADKLTQSNWSGFLLGMTLGILWTPCAGPVLGTILTLIATAELGKAIPMLVLFSIGAGVPMLLLAFGGNYVNARLRKAARYSKAVQRGFGIVVLALAVSMYFDYDLVLQEYLQAWFPDVSRLESALGF